MASEAQRELDELEARRAKDRERKRAQRAAARAQQQGAAAYASRAADEDAELKDAAARAARRRRKPPVKQAPPALRTPLGLAHTGRWRPTTPITYIPDGESERVVEKPTIETPEYGEVENWLDDIPEAVALDFHRRGAIEPELIPAGV